ncbi:helix-turn-helix domain-containing protein [Nonomuraea zeae]|uniref:Helix-turn-helix domain-containing protein n=1 Tax=Nonomuraea zeae TaxID=1642303 RepID=A0A5S4H4A2_9ACTN|nr:helix-turn-helix domain-containing protein [Nonomuraea zeae]TMR39574.1 helix-turn-helix domain-containing protein [Nonomuraea zeae]
MSEIPTETATSAAANLGISVGTLYRWLANGKIREHGVTGKKVDGRWVIMLIEDAEPATHETVAARIREIYPTIARIDAWGRPDWCSLTDLRKHLTDYPRQLVDETLVRMERTPDVNIVPEANQKTLTEEDWEAAVSLGGQRKHLFCIVQFND